MTEERKNRLAIKIVDTICACLPDEVIVEYKHALVVNAKELVDKLNFDFNQPKPESEVVDFKVKLLTDGAKPPSQKTDDAAGFDICADFTSIGINGIAPFPHSDSVFVSSGAILEDEFIVLPPLSHCVIPCGFAMSLPEGYEAQVRPRSGLAVRGLTLTNCVGTIDSDFRGEVKVIVNTINCDQSIRINHGDRIAQLVINKIPKVKLTEVTELSDTARGEGGFGSTGVK